MAQPSGEVFPPLTSTATTSNSRIPAAMEMIDDILPQPLEQGEESMNASFFSCF